MSTHATCLPYTASKSGFHGQVRKDATPGIQFEISVRTINKMTTDVLDTVLLP
jgi:hypothetical protein